MRAPHGGQLPAPILEVTGVTIQVSSPHYCCPLVRNSQIHEDLGVPLFANHIRALTESFDSRLADVGNPLVQKLGSYLSWLRVDPIAWCESQGQQGTTGQSRPLPTMAKSTKQITFGAEQPSAICMYVCMNECFVLPAQDTLCKHLHCILVFPLFKLLKYLVYVLVMLSSVGCMQLLCSKTFKCHFMLSIAFTTKKFEWGESFEHCEWFRWVCT